MLALDQDSLERRSLARNEVLFRQGDRVRAIYFIEEGRLRLERRTFDGRLLFLGTTLAGSGLDAESDYGYLFVAFRPDLFRPADTFERQVTQLIKRIKATHGSPASMTSAFHPSGHFALASAHSARAWRSTGRYSMRS
jgi:hypothetical protein